VAQEVECLISNPSPTRSTPPKETEQYVDPFYKAHVSNKGMASGSITEEVNTCNELHPGKLIFMGTVKKY
jgi:hypothetical protein